VSTSGTVKESAEAGAGNGTYSEREIVSKAVTGFCGEKYGTDSKNVTSTDKIFSGGRVITPISLLSFRIPNKNTLDKSRRKFI